MPGVVLVNPRSGPDETSCEDIAASFPGARVTEIEGKDVKAQVEEAVAEAPDFLAVAGGDGTLRCAAGLLADTPIALLPVPAGTRNHFAREVGICTLDDAARAREGTRRQVDVGEVNGEVFINNAGIGLYPRLVQKRKATEKRLPKTLATLAAVWHVRRLQRFNVAVDGRPHDAWMVFVGNGRYGRSVLDVADREVLDAGVLDVRILRARGRMARLRLLLALAAGRVEDSPMAVFDEAAEVELTLDMPDVDVALDGEIVCLSSPLRFRCRRGALTVLVPRDAEECDP